MADGRHGPSPADSPEGVRGLPAVAVTDLVSCLDNVAEAVMITDSHGRVQFWNAAATRLYGFPAHEVLGRSLDALILPLGRQPAAERVTNSGRAGEGHGPSDWLTRDREGRRFWVSATS